MPKANRILTYVVFLLRKFLGHGVQLKWVESRLLIAQLQSKLIGNIRQEEPLSPSRTFAIKDLEKALKFATWQIENEFTKEKWLMAISLIKSRVGKIYNDIIDTYSFAVFIVMGERYENVVEQTSQRAVDEFARQAAIRISELSNETVVDKSIEEIARETYKAFEKYIEAAKNK